MLTPRRGLLLEYVAKVFGDTSNNVDEIRVHVIFILYLQIVFERKFLKTSLTSKNKYET